MADPVISIVAGPTASGKSGYALDLARRENGTIINADSLQIYTLLPILTAQPSVAEQAIIPHLLYGVLPAAAQSTAAQWAEMAVAAIEETLAAGRKPILVGGTGLYLKTLIDGLSAIPSVPDDIRMAARDAHRHMGAEAFYKRLQDHDPVMAARLYPGDSQRVIRAWEVFEATGRSLAHWQSLPPMPMRPNWRYDVTMLLPDRDVLYGRCDMRFDQMLTHGVLDEVQDVADQVRAGHVAPNAACLKALGYRELSSALTGDMTLDDAVALAKQFTRNYAKRQVTWFKGQMQGSDKTTVRIIAG